jgi:hypothetical protein
MSSATPVVIVSVPNLPYFLGTFDTTNFKQWWRSAAFPDDIETITKGFHIYGRTHLAIAQRTDGLWAVYRSKNYGIDWERAWLASAGEKIYDVVLITFGWAILNTSAGFYETVNAGRTWTKISSLPGASATPAFCNIGGGDVLLCTDSRYIWRSTDNARSWTLVCDMNAEIFHHDNLNYYSGPSNACIAGANSRAYAAQGPFLIRSNDGGLTWGAVAYWEYNPTIAPLVLRPPKAVVFDRFYPRNNPGFLISQIKVSSVDGPLGDDVAFVLALEDIRPVSGYSDLFEWVFTTWTPADNQKNGHWKAVFQQYLTPISSCQHIDSYDVAVLGASYNDKLIFSAQTKQDANGNYVPSLKYSTDGGTTWIDIDLGSIQIGDSDGGGNYGGSMLDDNFAKLTWVGPPCNNYGSYTIEEQYRRQCQSYELDSNIEADKGRDGAVGYQADAAIEKDQFVTESVDALAEADIPKSYNVDAFSEGHSTKSYRIDRTCEGTSTKEQEVDAIVEKDQDIVESVDAIVWGRPKRYYLISAFLRSKRSSSYLCDTILVKDGSTETVQKMIAKFPQFMDLVDPGMPYEVYDSRKASS